jgi:hypothetical protein
MKGAYREIRVFVSCYRRFSCVVLLAAIRGFVWPYSAVGFVSGSPPLTRMRAYAPLAVEPCQHAFYDFVS